MDKHFIITLKPCEDFQTHRGVLLHDELRESPGARKYSVIQVHLFFYYNPLLPTYWMNLKRGTQILYPKDIGYILMTMGIAPGQHVMEAGTGSGQ